MEKVELEALLLTAAWVASLPSTPPCLTDTVWTKLGIGSCPVATWHKYSPASDACNNTMTIYAPCKSLDYKMFTQVALLLF